MRAFNHPRTAHPVDGRPSDQESSHPRLQGMDSPLRRYRLPPHGSNIVSRLHASSAAPWISPVKARQVSADGLLCRCAVVVREDYECLLRACTRLRSFSFHPHPAFPFNEPEGCTEYNPAWPLDFVLVAPGSILMERPVSGLPTLDLALDLEVRGVSPEVPMLTHATLLISLSLRVIDGPVLNGPDIHHCRYTSVTTLRSSRTSPSCGGCHS